MKYIYLLIDVLYVGICMLGLLHAIIHRLCLYACYTLTLFLCFLPYNLKHFSENVFYTCSLVSIA